MLKSLRLGTLSGASDELCEDYHKISDFSISLAKMRFFVPLR
jgi:hypothetical protein